MARKNRGNLEFNLRTIGPEPAGATPLEEEELKGLIPNFVATRADLNQVEFENISKALPWALEVASTQSIAAILEYGFVMTLHKRMFGDVWTWAGTQRRRTTNIGVEPHLIAEQSKALLDDAKFWNAHGTYGHDEIAARIHGRLVEIHPFPNGNGRGARMLADLYLIGVQEEPFNWGGETLDVDGSVRARYISALITADATGAYEDLVRFARGA